MLKVQSLLLALFVLTGLPAFSQETESAETSASSGRVEKLEVTGSHIKRIDVEGPSPVLTLDREYLDRSGYNSVADVLRDNAVSGLGAGREAGLSGGAFSGAATTSVRGMGSDSVLVLMDGQRLPTIGGSTSVDLNLIPMAAIERIDILKDGASATYGSDALGGVINFITKKDYDGTNISITHAQPEQKGGAKTDISATYGKTGSNYNILAVGQYRTNKNISMRDRDFFIPTSDYFSGTGSPGSWKNWDASESNWNAGGGSAPCTGDVSGSGRCLFDYSPYMQVIPDLEQASALVTGKLSLNADTELFAQALYTRREVRTVLAPAPDGFLDQSDVGGLDTRLPSATAAGWGLGGTTVNPGSPGNDVDVVYRLVEEAGPRISEVTSDNIGGTAGVRGYWGDSWDWEVSANYNQSQTVNRGVSGFANKSTLRDLAISNDWNPFAASGSKGDVSSAYYVPVLDIFSNVAGVQAKTSGELFELPAGVVGLAVGVSSVWQSFEQTSDTITNSGAQWGGGTSAEGKGSRNFQSVFAELAVPVLKNLELQLAGRFDDFSDFGSTVNPKVGLRYMATKSLMFRTSWGTGFKAPALEDVYGAQSVSYPFGFDPVTSVVEQFQTFGGGNRNLKQETSESFNIGFIWQLMESLSFGADYYYNNQDNLVFYGATAQGLRDIFRAEAAGIDLSTYGIQVIRNPANTGQIERIVAPTINLASRKTEGAEFRLAYNQKLFGSWNFNWITDYNLLLALNETPFPGLPTEKRAGFAGNPYFRTNTAIGLSNQQWTFQALIRTIGEQNWSINSPGEGGKTRDHTELDLYGNYTLPWQASVALGVRNVFNTDRPWQAEHTASGFLNTSLYDPFGRTVFMTYSQDF